MNRVDDTRLPPSEGAPGVKQHLSTQTALHSAQVREGGGGVKEKKKSSSKMCQAEVSQINVLYLKTRFLLV